MCEMVERPIRWRADLIRTSPYRSPGLRNCTHSSCIPPVRYYVARHTTLLMLAIQWQHGRHPNHSILLRNSCSTLTKYPILRYWQMRPSLPSPNCVYPSQIPLGPRLIDLLHPPSSVEEDIYTDGLLSLPMAPQALTSVLGSVLPSSTTFSLISESTAASPDPSSNSDMTFALDEDPVYRYAVITSNSISILACVVAVTVYIFLRRKNSRLMSRTSLKISVAMASTDFLFHVGPSV